MYITKKTIKGKDYFYLRKSVREGKKVKSINVAYLGKSLNEAKRKMNEIVNKKEEKAEGVKITYFVHGTTKDNEKGISSGQAPGELSELGIKQSKELPNQIKDKKFDAVFTSDLKRAVDSAKINFGKYKIIQDRRLRECNYGDLNQAKEEKIKYEEHIDKPFLNGESLKDVENRVVDFLNFLKKNYSGKQVAIVAHKATQLALDVLLRGKTWKQAIEEDWRKKKAWQPGWKYELTTEKQEIKVGNKIDEIIKIASNKGFFFQTANIYGGKAGFYTYGHFGKALKNNWESLWRKNILSLNENFYEIQSNNILPEEVFKASGHIENFNDPMIECKKCHLRFRADQFLEENGVENVELLTINEMNKKIKEKNLKCSKCGGEISEAKQFNMMFSVNVGFENEKAYLSPETAQGAYITFLEEFKANRSKLPLGLAIIDKAYRNEISPRQIFFRLREFSQAELQIFFDSDKINEHENWNEIKKEKLRLKLTKEKEIKEITCEEANEKLKLPKFYLYYAAKVQEFYLNILKIPKEKFRLRELGEKERAFYNKIHFDVEIDLETLGGFKEVAGVHYRTDHDLAGHQKISGKNLEVFYENKRILPHVLELSFGVDRNIWALLDIFCSIGKEGSMFKFPSKLAPVKVAVFPLVNDEKMLKLAKQVFDDLKKDFPAVYDTGGSIGRRYSRADEIGAVACITVDGDSLKDKSVTIRDRDTTEQVRAKISELRDILMGVVNEGKSILSFGKKVNTRVK